MVGNGILRQIFSFEYVQWQCPLTAFYEAHIHDEWNEFIESVLTVRGCDTGTPTV